MKTYHLLPSTLLILFIGTFKVSAQEIKPKATKTLDGTIEALYASISGEKGEARDWELFRSLFHPEAKLIPSRKDQKAKYVADFMTPEDYIEIGGPWLIKNGFYEKEIHRETDSFGPITQIFSTYESFHSESDEKPFMRGINSIQLLNDGKRWWILNIYWSQESAENQIPEEYLK